MINIRGLVQDLMTEKARQEQKVNQIYRQVVAEIFTDIVKHTPQFSGNLTSNWQIEFFGYPASGYHRSHRYLGKKRSTAAAYKLAEEKFGGPFRRGDNPAVGETLDRELPILADLRWNMKVRIINKTPYADDVEAGAGPNGTNIRDENLTYGKVAMANYAYAKYSRANNIVKIIKSAGG